MVVIGREAIAVAERTVMHDHAAGATARARREVCGAAALEVNDNCHDTPPPDHASRPCRSGNCEDTNMSRQFKRHLIASVHSQ
jgi:hypothetical protein